MEDARVHKLRTQLEEILSLVRVLEFAAGKPSPVEPDVAASKCGDVIGWTFAKDVCGWEIFPANTQYSKPLYSTRELAKAGLRYEIYKTYVRDMLDVDSL